MISTVEGDKYESKTIAAIFLVSVISTNPSEPVVEGVIDIVDVVVSVDMADRDIIALAVRVTAPTVTVARFDTLAISLSCCDSVAGLDARAVSLSFCGKVHVAENESDNVGIADGDCVPSRRLVIVETLDGVISLLRDAWFVRVTNEENDINGEIDDVGIDLTVFKGEADEIEEAAPETDDNFEEDEEMVTVCFVVFVVEILLVIVEITVFELIGLIVRVFVPALLIVL